MKKTKALNVVDVGESFECIAPKSKEHLALYCAVVFNVRFPYPSSDDEFCIKNGHASPLDAMWAAYAELDDFSIWYAMRGTGKTYDLSLLSFLEAVFKRHCGINILGGSLEQSTRAVAYLKELWETWKNLPSVSILDFRLKMCDINSLEYSSNSVASGLLGNKDVGGRGFRLSNGSWINALAASTKSVRGPHPQKLRLDEVDEMDRKIYDASMGQPKSNYGIKDNIIVSSTLHNAFGLMSEIIDTRDEIGAKLYPWCINEVREPRGFWTAEELDRRKKQITKEMWDAEYLLKRPKIGDTVFDFDAVDRAYRRGISDVLIPFPSLKNVNINTKLADEYFNTLENRIEIEAGMDWGYMVTVLNIIQDCKGHFKNPKSFPFEYIELKDRCNQIADICIEYRISKLYADSNPKDSNITLKKTFDEKNVETQLIPIAFNKWKSIAINVLRFMLERNILNITDYICQKKMKAYHYKKPEIGEIAKEDDHYPDSLIAWAASRYKILGI